MTPPREAAPLLSRPAADEVASNKRKPSARPRAASVAEVSYPVVTSCRRDPKDEAPAREASRDPSRDSHRDSGRDANADVMIAAGVPLPMSAQRVIMKVAGVGAIALITAAVVVGFARHSARANATEPAPATHDARTFAAAAPRSSAPAAARTPRPKAADSSPSSAPAPANLAGDTAAVAAVAASTAPHTSTAHTVTKSHSLARTPKSATPPVHHTKSAKAIVPTNATAGASGSKKSAFMFAKAPVRSVAKAPAKAHGSGAHGAVKAGHTAPARAHGATKTISS